MNKSELLKSREEEVQEDNTKMLGAHVEEDLYWEFKKAAAGRNEPLKLAVRHAARLYIDAINRGES